MVVSKERVVLGLLREKELNADPKATAEEAMRNNPATLRPNEPIEKIAKRMRETRGERRPGDDLGRQAGGCALPGRRRASG